MNLGHLIREDQEIREAHKLRTGGKRGIDEIDEKEILIHGASNVIGQVADVVAVELRESRVLVGNAQAQIALANRRGLVRDERPERIEYGDACLRLKRYDQAQTIFDEISAGSSKGLKEVELLRGLCALYRGQTTHAKGILNTALTHWPQDEDLMQVLELCSTTESE